MASGYTASAGGMPASVTSGGASPGYSASMSERIDELATFEGNASCTHTSPKSQPGPPVDPASSSQSGMGGPWSWPASKSGSGSGGGVQASVLASGAS